jgi:hypothetical protein
VQGKQARAMDAMDARWASRVLCHGREEGGGREGGGNRSSTGQATKSQY